MPKRTDIDSILIIGAGPIVIGQACEFDYSGTQACKALKDEGYRVILVNSNPATIMTDPSTADATYVEPITPGVVRRILEREKEQYPDETLALLPTMGGQTALNTALALERNGTLFRLGIEMIGAKGDVIDKAEDRQRFQEAMTKIGLECPRSRMIGTLEEAIEVLEYIGLPAIVRPSFTLGGTGGGIAYNKEEYRDIVAGGLKASPSTTVLIEESVLGWKEYEMEVVRDKNDNCIIVCSIENVDPMGIHTGDSITVAPALTLTDKEYQIMRNASIAVLREIGVETGGSNVQFAVNPDNGRLVVIEMNPRVSRSSALASKATGFPIAKVAAKLAAGYTLNELDNDITKITPASFEPTIDYVVTKIPRFTFEKFPGAEPVLTTSMKSVGEAMSVGRCFAESLQKGLRSMETGLTGLNEVEIPNAVTKSGKTNVAAIRAVLSRHDPDRLLKVAQAFRHGLDMENIFEATKIDRWFLRQIEAIVTAERDVRDNGLPNDKIGLLRLKKMGFSDERLAELTETTADLVEAKRQKLGVAPVFKRIDTCAAEFPSLTSYMYSCYEGDGFNPPECEADVSDRNKVVVLGGGPNRIGQGIEFDYCCVHACYALSEAGHESIMVNCNPETVSTDYDTSDRLYFEPLTAEDVVSLCKREQEKGELLGAIVQFGGQTPLKLSHDLEKAGIPILGTSPDAIDLAEDRERFQKLLHNLKLRQPPNGLAFTKEEAIRIANEIGYPVVIRPSYVLGGRAMEIVNDQKGLERYIDTAVFVSGRNPVLIDYYLSDATEVDVDALSDGENVHIAGIMEHVERAGVHSGDSACCLPPHSLPEDVVEEMKQQSVALARALNVVGLMNVQFAVQDGQIFILEVNPRASRTVPFVAKATGLPVAKIAARLMAGEKLSNFNLVSYAKGEHMAVKEAVMPFNRFPGVDVALGPEMRSTGEVMGLDVNFPMAFAKAQLASWNNLPTEGCVLISVADADKERVLEPVRVLVKEGFTLMATYGTARYLGENDLPARIIHKIGEGRPNVLDAMINGEVGLLFTTIDSNSPTENELAVRRTALEHGIPYYTTIRGCCAVVKGIKALRKEKLRVTPLQEYFVAS